MSIAPRFQPISARDFLPAAGRWVRTRNLPGLDNVVPLPEIGCTLPLSELYENVEIPTPLSDEVADEGFQTN